jgi:hypothetical protein
MHASRIVAHQDNPITLRTRLLSTPTPLKPSFAETGTTARGVREDIKGNALVSWWRCG